MKMRVKNWDSFQHYKDRSPPWIKFHKSLLDDFDFQRLQIASKALAPMLWLIASEQMDGTFNGEPERLAFRLRWPVPDVVAGLKPLIDAGFVLCDNADDSNLLAERLQSAIPETETETETETEGESRKKPRSPSTMITFSQWEDQVRTAGEKAISDYKPVWEYAETVGLQADWIYIAWLKFKERYTEDTNNSGKTYKDWRRAFLNAVKDNWFKLWYRGDTGFALTTTGEMADLETRA